MKILIATDGSKVSGRAADYGVGLAAKLGAEVLGLYVVNLKSLEFFALEHHDSIPGYESENAKLRREGEEALAALKKRCGEAGVAFAGVIARGYPADEINKLAAKEKVVMVVVGNVGRTGIEHVLLGSVSEAVVRKAPCPVLVVRRETQP